MKRMARRRGGSCSHRFVAIFLAALILEAAPAPVFAYAFGYIVGDMRQAAALSGGTACPQPTRFNLSNGAINRQWSTSLGTSPVTILTQDQTSAGQLTEIENVITASLGAWTGIADTALVPASLAPLARTTTQVACNSDGRPQFHLPEPKRPRIHCGGAGVHSRGNNRYDRGNCWRASCQ